MTTAAADLVVTARRTHSTDPVSSGRSLFVLLVSAAGVIDQYAILGSFGTAPLASYGQERTASDRVLVRSTQRSRAAGVAPTPPCRQQGA